MSKPITGKTTTSVWKQKRKNGDIYVWERKTVYIPETRKTKELSRKLLGKIPAGSTDGEIVPTRPKRKKTEDAVPQSSTRSKIGSTSLLRWVGEQSGITEDLLSCMDEGSAKKVDTIAQFWLANQGDRLQRMQKWQFLHPTPYPEPISKDVYHDLFEYLGLNEGIVQNYFLARAKRCHKEDAVAFDSSTVSSYSRYIKETRQGFNKAGDGLDTVKLLTLFDLATHQPIAFAREPGNLADVSGIENALKQFSFLNISKAQIVTDKGYYSQNNIGQMLRKHIKFLTAASIDLSWVNHHLQKNKSGLETASSLCPWDFNIHGITVPVDAEFTYQRQRNRGEAAKGDILSETRRLYLHLYLNRERVGEDEKRLATDLMSLKSDLEKGLWDELSESAQKKAEKYLSTSRLGRGGKLKVTINEEAYAQARKDYGYFALVSNKAEDCFEALRKYRLREKIEEAFKDTKNRLDGSRTRVWDGDTLKGRMFCQFVGLGYQCFLHTKIKELKEKLESSLGDKKLAEKDKVQNADLLKWLKKQSMQSLIDWFDCIELTSLRSDDGTVTQRSSDTKRDRLFFTLLGIPGFEDKPQTQLKVSP